METLGVIHLVESKAISPGRNLLKRPHVRVLTQVGVVEEKAYSMPVK